MHHVRASAVKAGLGFVLSREFPEKVRDLIRDPSPIRQGRPAILLVDELEEFRENAPVLEHVVQLFLSNRHVVVLATSVLPERLDVFTPAFKALLSRGRVVEMRLLPAAAGEEAEAMREEIAGLHAEVETLRWERFELERKLADSVGQVVAARREELESLRKQLEEARAEAASALGEQARLQGLLTGKSFGDEALQQAQSGRDAARSEVLRLREEMEAVLTRLDAYKKAFAERRVAIPLDEAPDPSAAESYALQAALAEAQSLANAFEIQLGRDRERFTAALIQAAAERDHANALLEEAKSEQGRLNVQLDAARGRLGVVEPELEKARRQVAIQSAEVDALRQAAAQEAARASIQAGEMEQRIARLESALHMMRQTSMATEVALNRVGDEFQRNARTLEGLAQRHGTIVSLNTDAPAVTPYPDVAEQGTLFEPDAAVEFGFEGPVAAPDARRTAPRLSEMVEQALYPTLDA